MDQDYFDSILLIISVALLFAGFFMHTGEIRLITLVLSGIFQGLYYGKNNRLIFHSPPGSEAVKENAKAKTNAYWVHMVCGTVGMVSLYFLLGRLDLNHPEIVISKLSGRDLILFTISLLGYTGLLPMTLFFFASGGKLLEKIIQTVSGSR